VVESDRGYTPSIHLCDESPAILPEDIHDRALDADVGQRLAMPKKTGATSTRMKIKRNIHGDAEHAVGFSESFCLLLTVIMVLSSGRHPCTAPLGREIKVQNASRDPLAWALTDFRTVRHF